MADFLIFAFAMVGSSGLANKAPPHPTWRLAGAGGAAERALTITLAFLSVASVGWALSEGPRS